MPKNKPKYVVVDGEKKKLLYYDYYYYYLVIPYSSPLVSAILKNFFYK